MALPASSTNVLTSSGSLLLRSYSLSWSTVTIEPNRSTTTRLVCSPPVGSPGRSS